MPGPSQPTMTLEGLIPLVRARDDIAGWERRQLVAAIRSFAKVCARAPGDILADPSAIRALVATAQWKLAGYKKASWANILSRLRKALELGGVKVHRQRRNFKLDTAWQTLCEPLSKRDRGELHRFAGWCSIMEISPTAVTSATFHDFYRYLDEQMTQRDPRERGHVARRAWNRAIAANDSSLPEIPSPEPAGRSALPWSDFPGSLRDEVRDYSARMLEEDFLDDEHRPLKPITVDGYKRRLRVMLTLLVDAGVPANDFQSLATVIEPARVKRAFTLYLNGHQLNDRSRQYLHTIAVAVLSVARYLDASKDIRDQLRKLAKKVRFTPSGICERNRQRLHTILDPDVRNRLLRLPLRIMADLKGLKQPTVRQAQRMQMAVLLEILLHVPMRIKNAGQLDLTSTLAAPIGSTGRWRISIPGHLVKNLVAVDAELSESTSKLLTRYTSVFRPVLAHKASTALFLSQNGTPKAGSALSKQFAAFVWREAGIVIHAHLTRHLAATLYLIANPGDFETARRLLGHKSINTTISFYEGLGSDDSFALYHNLLEGHRAEPDLPRIPLRKTIKGLEEVDTL